MTTLNSLEVQGIRSFSPDEVECLQFEKPLTLIVGHNGSGKTTLIECLKAVTSGILPPNSDKGKCFIYDYRLNNLNEVRGHIKLSFTRFNNEKVSVLRSYTISGDKYNHKKITFKGTENVLEVNSDNGKKRCITMKTTDIDVTLPTLMGFTRAIIDNVIFCHQDENHWPLDDLSKVKARFDDLLETSRYTKALVVLNKAKKEQEDVIKNKQKQLEIYKSQILQITDIKKQLDSDQEDIIKTKLEIEALEKKLKQSTEILMDLKTEYEKIALILDEYKNTENTYLKAKEEHDKLHESLVEIYEEPLEDIKEYYITLTTELKISESQNSTLSENIEKLVVSLNEAHSKLRESKGNRNNYLVLLESKGSVREILDEITTQLRSELNLTGEIDSSKVALRIGVLSDISLIEKDLIDKIKEKDEEVKKVEADLVSVMAERKTLDIIMKSVDTEIASAEISLSERNGLLKTQNDLKQEINTIQEVISEDVKTHEILLSKREALKSKGYRIRNAIVDVNITDEDIKYGTKLLVSIIENDKECVSSYLKTLSTCNLDQDKLVSTIKGVMNKLFQEGDPMKSQSFPVCKKAIDGILCDLGNVVNMYHNCENTMINNPSIESGDIFEPYDEFIRFITNTRIKEYLSYYNSLLSGNNNDEEISCKEIKKQLINLNKEIESKEKEISHKKRKLEQSMADHDTGSRKLDECDMSDIKMKNLRKRKDAMIEDIRNIETRVETLKKEMDNASNERSAIKAELDDIQKKKDLKKSKMSILYKQYTDAMDKMKSIENEIRLTPDLGSVNHKDIETYITTVNNEIKDKMKLQAELNDKINEQKRVVDLLHQNIEYKTRQGLLWNSEQKLDEIKKRMGGKDVDAIDSEITSMNRECAEITLKIATLNGMIFTKEEHVDKLKTLLESKPIKDAQKMYTETYIELKSHQMTKEDLEKYSKVLESGLHKYHSEKIDYINNVLKRVWRDVYTGDYIDYIAIQSNVDENALLTETSKSYNYKIIMVLQNGTKMDMKGHCSAGERILSSLIIRIALIESFSENCGILALDEPTTNLDKENIRSLELSLSKLVNESFHNFQLIIITHDEEFAKKMATLCSCDKYFRLDKRQNTTKIIKEKI